jgi:hypothetical protein
VTRKARLLVRTALFQSFKDEKSRPAFPKTPDGFRLPGAQAACSIRLSTMVEQFCASNDIRTA